MYRYQANYGTKTWDLAKELIGAFTFFNSCMSLVGDAPWTATGSGNPLARQSVQQARRELNLQPSSAVSYNHL